MDEIVAQAMRKWPNVPACWDWLALDARGDWYMRDAQTQRHGPFAGPGSSPASKGSRITHPALRAFIARNYTCDAQGAWYFQNGPQRVYVSLAETPWILRLDNSGRFTTHTELDFPAQSCWLDERGMAYITGPLGLGLVHTLDTVVLFDWLTAQAITPSTVSAAQLPQLFSYQRQPRP